MKNILFASAVAATYGQSIEQFNDDTKVVVDLYYEALCNGCRQAIKTSFADAAKADGFFDMATINFYPFGNAKEKKTIFGKYEYTCQHGLDECQYNFIESCALNLIDSPQQSFDFIDCIEDNDVDNQYEKTAKQCAKKAKIDVIDDILACFNGNDAIKFEHEMAQATAALSPAHTYVPWVVAQGVHDDDTENAIL